LKPPVGPTIDTIIVITHNVFESSDFQIGFLTRMANAIHVKTHPSIIRRTLLLNAGEPYDSARALESERALRGLNVFRDVKVDTVRVAEKLALRVETADGWSTKPQVNIASADGDVTWQLGMIEENLFGTATSFTALYTNTPDRDYTSFLYQNPHLFSSRVRLLGLYQSLSDGDRGSWALGIPFYETSAPWAAGTGGEAATQRILQFRDGKLLDYSGQYAAVVDSEGRQVVYLGRHALRFGLGVGRALHASTHGYTRLWVNGAWRREDFVPESISVVPYSSFATVGAGLEFARARYAILQRFNTYGRREDVNLSTTFRFGFWAAPQAFGYPEGQAGVGAEASGQWSEVWPGGFALFRASTNGVYNGSAVDSARVHGSVTVASQNFELQTILVHLEGGLLRKPKPGAEFDPWVDQTGPRLFGAHAFTGTRTFWLAVEDRFVIADDFLGLVGVGIAPFFDWGGAWFDDEAARTGNDFGLALRLGPTRAVRGDVVEFALGWRFGPDVQNHIALSIRRGIGF